MNCISLLTDFGLHDEYVGVMKGVILGINPNAKIIDITHDIQPQNIIESAYMICASFQYFPPKTIHVIVVDPGVGANRGIIGCKFKDFFFLAPDNGVLTLIMDNGDFDALVRIENSQYFLDEVSNTFHGRDIFAPVAAHLSKGLDINKLGTKVNKKDLIRIKITQPFISSKKELTGTIISCDRFGNLVTNIESRHFFLQQDKIQIKIGKHKLTGLSQSYSSVKPYQPLAVIGSRGYLEIAVNLGNAKKYFGVKKGDNIKIIKT